MSNRRVRMKEMEKRMRASFARQLGCKSIEEVDKKIQENLKKSSEPES